MVITSPDNPLARRLKRLIASARECRASGRTLIEGVHLLDAASRAGARLHTLVVRSGTVSAEAQALVSRLQAEEGVRCVTFSGALYDLVSPVEHGAGVLAEIGIPPPLRAERIDADAVYLDGVQDPGNVGTLLRTAAAAGVRSVLAGAGCAQLWSPKVMRAGMGAHFALRLEEDVALDAMRARFSGSILAADAGGGDDLYAPGWEGPPTLWLFGAEGQGLSDSARAIADRRLRIPVDRGVESLNVAAAAAICLFEQRRRRIAATGR